MRYSSPHYRALILAVLALIGIVSSSTPTVSAVPRLPADFLSPSSSATNILPSGASLIPSSPTSLATNSTVTSAINTPAIMALRRDLGAILTPPDLPKKRTYTQIPQPSIAPGRILHQEIMKPTLGTIPFDQGFNAHLISYSSRDGASTPIATTGTVLTPKSPSPQDKLVILAPGTQGAADKCAPSHLLSQGLEYELIVAALFLSQGYTVAIPDYEGLGTPGAHRYMQRLSQAHTVLDIGRAVTQSRFGIINSHTPILLWGYSQGGGASASAGEQAPYYAPELNIRAGYAGGVPADLALTAEQIDGGVLVAALAYTINGFMDSDPAIQEAVKKEINPRGMALLEEIKEECAVESIVRHAYVRTEELTSSGLPLKEILKKEPFASLVRKQEIGHLPPPMPYYVGHGVNDDVIPIQSGRVMAQRWCQGGSSVYWSAHPIPTTIDGLNHILPMLSHLLPAYLWADSTLVTGTPPLTTSCSAIL